MKKNVYYLGLLLLIFFSFFSCRNEEFYNSIQQTSDYTSKSPWKEDEVYIKNVKLIFEKYADLGYFENKYGQVYWNYAMSFGKFDETFLIVPIVKNNEVVTTMKVLHEKGRVFIYEEKDYDIIAFFDSLLNLNLLSFYEKKVGTANGINNKLAFSCTYRTITVGCFENQSDCIPISRMVSSCSWIEDGDNGGRTDQMEIAYDGGGGGDIGLLYPNDITDPCESIKAKQNNEKYSENFKNLNRKEIFSMDRERGFFERQPPPANNQESSFIQMDNLEGTSDLDLPDNKQGIIGLLHSHNDEEGVIKIFSPTDVRTFINNFMPQANAYTGSYGNAYSTVVTSEGSYTLKFSGNLHPGGINYDTFTKWSVWYEREYKNLIMEDKLTQENVEKIFAQFLKEVVNVDGLEVYKVTENSSTKIQYDGANNPPKTIPCQ